MGNLLPKSESYAMVNLRGAASLEFGQRMFSRNLKNLAEGDGVLSLFLSAEAKVLSIFWVVRKQDGLLLLTPSVLQQSLVELIEKYHFSENFQTEAGPIVATSWAEDTSGLDGQGKLSGSRFRSHWKETRWEFQLETPPSESTDSKEWESHRIQRLIPKYSADFDSSTFVYDLGWESLCDENKGCYIGQEVVERVRSRGGHFPRRLVLLKSQSPFQPGEFLISADGQEIGSITRSNAAPWSLAVLKRNFAEVGTKLAGKLSKAEGEVVRAT